MGTGEAHPAFEHGNQLAAEGNLTGAERAYREADASGHPTAAAYVGVFEESRGNTGGAIEAYRRADERGDGLGALRLGLMLGHVGDWDEANAAFERADERGTGDSALDIETVLGRSQEHPRPVSGAQRSALANPVLVGAVTVLAVIVAVFLAYTANRGLPFLPTKELKVDIANGSDLVAGNDVREGGFLVGLVSDMKPIALPGSGQVGAQLILKLSASNSRVPVDTTATILPRSVLGTKFVQLNIGHAQHEIADGGVLPISQTSVPLGLDDVLSTFNGRTRTAVQQDLVGFGDTLAARGSALNDTFANLPQLLAHLGPVAQYLSDPHTQLNRLLQTLNTFVATVAPVAATNARLFTDAATTFAAISSDPNALETTIARTPPTLDVSTNSLAAQRPFLTDLTTLGHALTPATASLAAALPQINPALETGSQVLPRTPALNARLDDVLAALRTLARAPGTNQALNALTATVGVLNPIIRYIGPYQTVCDDWTYFWTYFSDHVSEQTSFGEAQRVLLNFANPTQTNNVGSLPATQPASGNTPTSENLHNGSYAPAIDASGLADCETGQRGYVHNLNHGDPLHRNLGTDATIPGNQGPTYAGRARVPAGETFTPTAQPIP